MDQSALEALLSELRASQDPPKVEVPPPAPLEPAFPTQDQLNLLLHSLSEPAPPVAPSPTRSPSPPPQKPLSNLTFTESLPHLHELSLSPQFLTFLQQLSTEQQHEELRLRDERNRLSSSLARSDCSEVEKEKKLKEWDKSARNAWEKLQKEQVQALTESGVPCLGEIEKGEDKERRLKSKKRVMDVLAAFLEDKEAMDEEEEEDL